MTKAALFALTLSVLGSACGDDGDSGSGLDRSGVVTALPPADLMTLCEWSTETQGGAGTTTECGDHTVTVEDAPHCADGFTGKTCTLTVGQLEDCVNVLADDPCGALQSSSCGPVIECAFAGP